MSRIEENTQQSNNSMMLIIGVVAIVVVGAGAFFLLNRSNTPATQQVQTETQSTTEASPTGVMESVETTGAISEAKTFVVEASPFAFSPNEIRVKKGDKVKIVLNNKSGTHAFTLDEFNVKTKTLQSGQSDTVEFTGDKTGTFEFYCSVGNHRAMGMVGNLIVE